MPRGRGPDTAKVWRGEKARELDPPRAAVAGRKAIRFFRGLRPRLAADRIGCTVLTAPEALRYALLSNGYFGHWTDLLERTMRMPVEHLI